MQGETCLYDYRIDPLDSRVSYYWLLNFSQGAKTALEIGCSTGFFSRYLQERGCLVTGIDINGLAAEQARQYCVQVIVGDIESEVIQASIKTPFDVVILGDVLEHMKDPARLLEVVRHRWLSQNGKVVMSVPNSGHWIFRREILLGRFPYRQEGLFDRTHLRFFTRSGIHDLVTQNGFNIEQEAVTVNLNNRQDLTFSSLAILYHYPGIRALLVQLEKWLANYLPDLFAYQFVISLFPTEIE